MKVMNYATCSVLDEMESELLGELEYRETKVNSLTQQVKATLSTIWRIASCFISGFVASLIALVVLSFVITPTETVDFLRSATREQLLTTLSMFLNLSYITAFIWMIFNVLSRRIRFVSIERLKREAIEKQVQEAHRVIEIAEEVLLRHELIRLEDKR